MVRSRRIRCGEAGYTGLRVLRVLLNCRMDPGAPDPAWPGWVRAGRPGGVSDAEVGEGVCYPPDHGGERGVTLLELPSGFVESLAQRFVFVRLRF